MLIEITSRSVDERSGTKNGKDWKIRTQIGYARIPDRDGNEQPYPESIKIDLAKDQPPYEPGLYVVADNSYYVGDFQKLTLGRLVLAPAKK